MKTKLIILVLCSAMSIGLFAQNNASEAKQKYTFSDFFDALDLPTVLGVGFTPNGIESATFNSAMRLGWRHHKNYGTFVYITYDTHSNTYDSLLIQGTNIRNGEVWYNEIGMSVGYRIPLVKDIKAFYEKPYFHPWDVFVSIQPGVSIATVKNIENYVRSGEEVLDELGNAGISGVIDPVYEMKNYDNVVPTLRFSAGVEWFIMPNFGVFAEASYTQHLMPTIIEQAAINKGEIKNPSGPITLSVGLSLFFN
ncbi:MAG: hypothetical protein IKY87_03885 [Paludibacteraceae bacterium]|nr:hypothetical protein [Paludibacteraceae bacterium]